MKPFRGRKSLFPRDLHDGIGINRWFGWTELPYGSERRKLILEHLENIKNTDRPYVVINKRHCIILKRDPDLKRLLKQGKVKMIKIKVWKKHTYSGIVLT